jgi:uncharacterized protein (DUF305 family)
MRLSLLRPLIVALVACTAACGRAGTAPPRAAEAPRPQAVPLLQPGAPGGATRSISVADATDLSKVRFTDADARFMTGMIGHHAQAVEMVALIDERTASDAMRLLGKRIEVSQTDEMQMMREWLSTRGLPAPDPHAHHMHGATLMPGMLTPEEMERLAAARGVAFDRLFLDGMIKHHRGALTMVEELFASAGGAQDSEIYSFASDVDADQRMEIDRMGAMLQEMSK